MHTIETNPCPTCHYFTITAGCANNAIRRGSQEGCAAWVRKHPMPDTSLAGVPVPITPDPQPLDTQDSVTLRALYADAQNGLRRVVALGLFCADVKLNRLKHGQFQSWLQEHCPEISYRSLSVYMQVTQSAVEACGLKITDVVQKCSALHFSHSGQLLLLPEQEMPTEAAAWRHKLCDLLDGKSLRQLMLSFKGETAAGKYHPPKPQSPEESERAEAAQADDLAKTPLADMNQMMEGDTWSRLTKARRDEIEQTRLELGTFIKSCSRRGNEADGNEARKHSPRARAAMRHAARARWEARRQTLGHE